MNKNFRSRLNIFGKYLLLIIFVTTVFSYAMFQGGFVSWFLFYSVIAVSGLTVAVSFFTFRGFQVERVFNKETLNAGETLQIQLTLKKKALHPFFYVRVLDKLPVNLGENEKKGALFFFTFSRQLKFSYEVKDVRRGEHVFSEVELVFGDLFGLYEKRNTVKCEGSVLVYPYFQRIEHAAMSNSADVVEGTASTHSFDDDRSLAGVRGYVPGDRLSSIDWKQSARKGLLMTKEFESFRGSRVIVAFDAFQRHTLDLHFEKTVELATSLVASLSKVQPSLQVAFWGADWLRVDTDQHSINSALKMFAQVTKVDKEAPTIHGLYQQWRGSTVYYVCSELNEGLVETFKVIRMQGVNVQIFLVVKPERSQLLCEQLEKLGVSIHTISA
ncbi:DUF58 domain-containing protein [Bacillus solitudinis]|uniref:DUF58 domain-containing protein n=1 Tax=Bacillus solitudinis TaxID=2014074 RepID=UPI000C24F9FD|nr:DUF58 domain-containing protein [Bacillus solitudinis]